MSINANNSSSLNSDTILNQAVVQILGGHQDAAFARLTKCGLFNDEQIAKIRAVLTKMGPSSIHSNIKPLELKSSILKALNPEIKIAQALPKDKPSHLCFTETSTCELANAYPCKIEFGGKYYANATICFLAQQYTDQPHIMDLLTKCETAEEALFLSSTCPMTKERKLSWENLDTEHINKNDVMMHVLRAKFGQNPELKEKLLALGGIYIVAQGNDPYLSDCFNGTGQNQLGISLMCLQGEYGGTGIIKSSTSYNKMTLDLKDRCQFLVLELNEDIISEIFGYCLSGSDVTSVAKLSLTNVHFYKHIMHLVNQLDLKKICPELRILDAQTLGLTAGDEPSMKKLALIKSFKEMAFQVEDNAGLTLLTMTKGLTLNQLVVIAEKARIKVSVPDEISIELGDVPVEHTYRIVITNNVFINSRVKSYDKQQELVLEIGCEMPTVQEYVALCIFTKVIFNICLYGRTPLTYGRSSTHVWGYPLVVVGRTPARLDLNAHHPVGHEDCGAGGRRK